MLFVTWCIALSFRYFHPILGRWVVFWMLFSAILSVIKQFPRDIHRLKVKISSKKSQSVRYCIGCKIQTMDVFVVTTNPRRHSAALGAPKIYSTTTYYTWLGSVPSNIRANSIFKELSAMVSYVDSRGEDWGIIHRIRGWRAFPQSLKNCLTMLCVTLFYKGKECRCKNINMQPI